MFRYKNGFTTNGTLLIVAFMGLIIALGVANIRDSRRTQVKNVLQEELEQIKIELAPYHSDSTAELPCSDNDVRKIDERHFIRCNVSLIDVYGEDVPVVRFLYYEERASNGASKVSLPIARLIWDFKRGGIYEVEFSVGFNDDEERWDFERLDFN